MSANKIIREECFYFKSTDGAVLQFQTMRTRSMRGRRRWFKLCNRGRCDQTLGTCSSGWSHDHRRRLHSWVSRSRGRDDLVRRNCSSFRHRVHHHPRAGTRARCGPPRCNCSKSWSGRLRIRLHHHRPDAASNIRERCGLPRRSCSKNGRPS